MDFNTFDHIIAFVVIILLPGISFLSSKGPQVNLGESLPPKVHIYVSNGLVLWIGALLVLTGWNLSNKDWAVLGIRWPELNTYVIAMTIGLIGIYIIDSAVSIFTNQKQNDEKQFLEEVLPENWQEYSQYSFLAISAGICEEIVYRGFLINYILHMTLQTGYGLLIALILPSVVFAVSHLYQGWFSVFKIFALSLLFSGIFLLSKSLLLVIILHVLVDLVSGALFVMMKKRGKTV